jgi:hypothetical protein
MSAEGYGVCYALVRRLLRALPVDAIGRRVFDETLADWRRELQDAPSLVQKLRITARNGVAAGRGVLMVSLGEVTRPEGRTLLLKVVMWSCVGLLAFFASSWELLYVTASNGRALYGYDSLALLSVSWMTGLMPLLVFLSAACARRTAAASPRLGPALVMGVVMVGLLVWAVPVANQAFREFTFARTGGTGGLPRGLAELSLTELIASLRTGKVPYAWLRLTQNLIWLISVPVLLTLGAIVRGLAGWKRIAGTVLPLVMFLVPAVAGLDLQAQVFAYWAVLAAATFVMRRLVHSMDQRDAVDGAA